MQHERITDRFTEYFNDMKKHVMGKPVPFHSTNQQGVKDMNRMVFMYIRKLTNTTQSQNMAEK